MMAIIGWICVILASIWCGGMAWLGVKLSGFYSKESKLLTLACIVLALIAWINIPFSITLK
jgi:hypothetical protein